ncbi:trans-aconitate 3-methyltransferase KNAG_0G01930 [Huiozyma naganishii CBS 8797]|uniref:Methyltransferase domain-containing protein n=1 Tax=Huiozyma naganishii (strain ATCC MYA-139 / BCRC 22969 / CBS 8797 / KCTC 17520 / NBRC 10181 / NCYC 3082 / Yp74L-3) TaxID=1071383 RepID=J7R8Q1_HUIN7|nr:hypothetical protein KNAG_0G01930 [Kazachstania naganishii CBS 8797]CCK71250.1 hypothetical protein KNAG_0G01930 [Kazachstania naganishii CBS 8797]
MSTFSAKDFDTHRYEACRPSYPPQFYDTLISYHEDGEESRREARRGGGGGTPPGCVLDIGCGPGTATFELAHRVPGCTRVVGCDVSRVMVEQAESRLAQVPQERPVVEFRVCSYDQIEQNHEYDLVTAVECAHWFDFNKFQESVAGALTTGGTVAVWGYADQLITGYPDLDELYLDFAYGDDHLGPYWQQPGRSLLRTLLKGCEFRKDLFRDVQEVYSHATDTQGALSITKRCILREYGEYLRTFSAYHSWKADVANKDKTDVCDEFLHAIMQRHPGMELDSEVHLVWNTFYKFARRV